MEYVNDVNISDAVIHILDNNADEPILNEHTLALGEELYKFILKHVQKCFKDEELKYAVFKDGRNIVKELSQEYLNGESDFLSVSKELAKQLFGIMKSNANIPSCDLLTVALLTEHGPMLGILKMDYIRNYMHSVDFTDNKIDIKIIEQFTGLPGSGQKLQKCAFIKPISGNQKFNLMVIDKQSKSKNSEDYGTNYFLNSYLGCNIVENERDVTKNFVKAAEKWTQKNLKENAEMAETVRSNIKKKLKEEDNIDVKELSDDIFKDQKETKDSFMQFVSERGIKDQINVDKQWVDNKLKRKRLKIDKDIDIYINEDAYNDNQRFEIVRNGDGSINMTIKHVTNYIEK